MNFGIRGKPPEFFFESYFSDRFHYTNIRNTMFDNLKTSCGLTKFMYQLYHSKLPQKFYALLNKLTEIYNYNTRNTKRFTSYSGAPKAGGRRENCPLPFNILKTRGQRGQIVLFKISTTDKFF